MMLTPFRYSNHQVLKVEEPGCSNPVSQSSPILDALSSVAANVAASAAKPMIDPQNDEEDPSQVSLCCASSLCPHSVSSLRLVVEKGGYGGGGSK